MICPKCNSPNPAGAAVCQNCQAVLAAPQVPPPENPAVDSPSTQPEQAIGQPAPAPAATMAGRRPRNPGLKIWLLIGGGLLTLGVGAAVAMTVLGVEISRERQPTSPPITPRIYQSPIPSPSTEDLPSLFPGYSWQECQGMKAKFQMPAGWYFKQEVKDGTHACFITKESIDAGGQFKTGLSVNAVRNVAQKTGLSPSRYAQTFLEDLGSRASSAGETIRRDNNGLVMFSKLTTVKGQVYATKSMNIVIANDVTGTMYILIFESPENEWLTYSAIGERLTGVFSLDRTY